MKEHCVGSDKVAEAESSVDMNVKQLRRPSKVRITADSRGLFIFALALSLQAMPFSLSP